MTAQFGGSIKCQLIVFEVNVMTLREISIQYGVDAKRLKTYFQAFSNFYGICSLKKAMQIINRQNPEQKITKEQILGFADNYNGDWKIVSPYEIYTDIPYTTPLQREIVNKILVFYNDYGGYHYTRALQSDKDFYIPSRDELLKYADKKYFEENQYTHAFAQFLEKQLHANDWQRKLLEIVLDIRADNFDTQDFIDTIDQEYPGFDITQQVIDIYVNLHNNTRLMVNRGYTPNELFRKYDPDDDLPKTVSFGPGIYSLIQSDEMIADELIECFEAMNISQDLKRTLISEIHKVKRPDPGRNDPCPCGSGKKYKKCCGG